MHQIEFLIHKFLEEIKEGKTRPDLLTWEIDEFTDNCRASLERQIFRDSNKFSIRMSNIGRPICQLQHEQLGTPGDIVETDIIRNLYGDITEKIVMFLLYASGVPIISEQEKVSLEIGGIRISGTLDLVIDFGDDPRAWDIKSASDYAFKNKFNKSFEEIIANDTFGYGEQIFLYAEAKQLKVGGLIAVNKSTSEIRVVAAPKEQELLRETCLRRVEKNVSALSALPGVHSNDVSKKRTVVRQFEPIKETYYKKETGNYYLGIECQYCPYKFTCWPSLEIKPNPNSKSANPELRYYVNENKEC